MIPGKSWRHCDLRKVDGPPRPGDPSGGEGVAERPGEGQNAGLQMKRLRVYQPHRQTAIRLIQRARCICIGDTAELEGAPRYGCDLPGRITAHSETVTDRATDATGRPPPSGNHANGGRGGMPPRSEGAKGGSPKNVTSAQLHH